MFSPEHIPFGSLIFPPPFFCSFNVLYMPVSPFINFLLLVAVFHLVGTRISLISPFPTSIEAINAVTDGCSVRTGFRCSIT